MSTCHHLYKQTKTMLLKLCVMWLTAFCCHAQNAVNVALNKTTSQSTYYRAFTSGSTAVDGRTPGGDVTQFMTCIHTSENPRDEFPSWEVDLGHVYPVAYITIYGRPGFLHRMVNTDITIDNHTCLSIKDIPSTNPVNLSCTTALSGRIVRIERHSRDKKDFSLNMCEVEVWVCKDGKYGANCDQSCGHCEGETCDKASGRCPRGCDPGWRGQQCHTSCRDGRYGWSCSQSCGQCANSSTCDKVTGRCPIGCQTGWTDDLCQTACEDGKYGWSCSQSCGQCANSTCDKVTGTCPSGCAAGWTDDLCQTACEDGTYGWNCSQSCGECANVPCDKVTGRCPDGCQPGWKDDLCQTVNVALNKTTKQSSTHSKFPSGFAAVDGRTPGGDITQFMTCIHTSINPRDEFPSWEVDLGHVYPVAYITIYGRPGFLHRMVNTDITIDNHTCLSIQDIPSTNPVNLSCTTALSGRIVRIERHSRDEKDFSLNMCEVEVWVCKDGKYGANCHQSCGHCEGETCDKDSGRCPRGCAPGWQGQQCHTSCRDGRYGWSCSQSCGQCANSSTCDKVTGRCPIGCQTGWTDDLCQTGETS